MKNKKIVFIIIGVVLAILVAFFIISKTSFGIAFSSNGRLIKKYWEGYIKYDEEKMKECFVDKSLVTEHTGSIPTTGYNYEYEKPIIKDITDEYFNSDSNYHGEVVQHEKGYFKKENGEEFTNYKIYKVTINYKAGTSRLDTEGYVEFIAITIKYKGKHYLLYQPEIKYNDK